MDLYLQIWLVIKIKFKSNLTPRKIKNKLFRLLHLFHCFKFNSFCWGQSITINDQKREKWEGCFIDFFLFEICLGGETIQK